MSQQIVCSLDVRDNYTPDYYEYMDIKQYKAIGINGKRCTVYAKNLTQAKIKACEKMECVKCKKIYRV